MADNKIVKKDKHWLFQPGQSGNLKGRPRKLLTKLELQGYTKGEIDVTIDRLLALNKAELHKLDSEPAASMLERIMAKAMLRDHKLGVYDTLERVINRRYGQPKSEGKQDVTIHVVTKDKTIEVIQDNDTNE